jgi:NADPH-dependent 2,4-dienoyl-CoA reductase/sulfur reductase-like enzyme
VLEHLQELETANGVVVDRSFATSAPGVWAAGDIAEFPDPIYGRRRRIEHWSTAAYQGTQVGRVLAGEDAPYDTLSTFFSEVFGFVFKFFGDATGFEELVWEGSLEEGKAVGRYLGGGRLIAAVLTGQEEETESRLKEDVAAGARGER